MSIDDDGFDIEAALEKTEYKKAAERFITWAYEQSRLVDRLNRENEMLREVLYLINKPNTVGKPNVRRFMIPVRRIR